MIKSRWVDEEFTRLKSDLEQRVYSSRLLGVEPDLVLHGGGNTSVKTKYSNLRGQAEDVICVKGSGWDLATIEPEGFAIVRMEPLLKLRCLHELSDLDMMNELRTHLVHMPAPDPSVETLLHAFLPHRFVDHTHADAILTLTNQPDGERFIKNLFGNKVGIVPYVMPGFRLAKLCASIFENDPSVDGLILLKHGVFTFGDSANEAYERMISLVQKAEAFIQQRVPDISFGEFARQNERAEKWMAGIRREYLKRGLQSVLSLECGGLSLEYVNRSDLQDISQRGPITPDHVLRTKRAPLVALGDPENIPGLFSAYVDGYRDYFSRNKARTDSPLTTLDPFPRVILIPQLGIVSAGATAKDALVVETIFQHTAKVILQATGMNGYECLQESDIFDVEYWALEQAKLRLGPKRSPLTGKIAIVSGGASGIGLAIAREFLTQGAEVFVLDIDDSRFPALLEQFGSYQKGGNRITFLRTDVTSRGSVADGISKIARSVGGLDIAVINAGIFPPSHVIDEIPEEEWGKSLDTNLSGSFHVVAESLKRMKPQGTGGDIVFIASKNVPAPGKQAASYSVAKAGQTQLARVCALEAAPFGIRVNTLHPHLILDTAIWTEAVLSERAKAYGMTTEEYKRNNLLKTEVTSTDVARAAFALVSGYFSKTTGAQISVDGGSERTL